MLGEGVSFKSGLIGGTGEVGGRGRVCGKWLQGNWGEALADPFISLKLSRGLWSVEGLRKGFLRGVSGGVRS